MENKLVLFLLALNKINQKTKELSSLLDETLSAFIKEDLSEILQSIPTSTIFNEDFY
jgi:uncharacterized membrane protein YheB (UPF0754 family)